MNLKKIAALLMALLLISCMGTSVFAQDVTVSTTVPEWHSVSIEVEGGGKVVVDHQICGTTIRVARQSEQTYWLIPDGGRVLSVLYYNGADVTAQVRAGVFTAPALTNDASLKAVFEDAETPSEDTRYDVSGTITGPDGKPISGVTVDIGGQTGTTDEDGNFNVEDVPTGTHTVTVADPDGEIIGIGEITIKEPEDDLLTTTTDGNGNPVITPGRDTEEIHLELTVGEDGVITIENVKDVTSSRTEPEKPADTDKPGNRPGSQSSAGSQSGGRNPGPGRQSSGADSPKTGDSRDFTLWSALLLASCAALTGAALRERKKKIQ